MEKTFTRIDEITSKLDGDFLEVFLKHAAGQSSAKLSVTDPAQPYYEYENNDGRSVEMYISADDLEAVGLLFTEFAKEMRKRGAE